MSLSLQVTIRFTGSRSSIFVNMAGTVVFVLQLLLLLLLL